MKHLFIMAGLIGLILFSCQKKEHIAGDLSGMVSFKADSLTYNTVTKTFSPNNTVQGTIEANQNIKEIYYYLQSAGTTDKLIYTDTTLTGSQKKVDFSIPVEVFGDLDMTAVTGVKVMIKLQNNGSAEKTIKITAYNPSIPNFANFPTEVDAQVVGDMINIKGKITSEDGLKKITIQDNASGEFADVNSISDLESAHDYDYDYDYTYSDGAYKLKIIAENIKGLTNSIEINIKVTPPGQGGNYDKYEDVVMGAQNSTDNNSFFFEDGTVAGACGAGGNETNLDFLLYMTGGGDMKIYSPDNSANIAKSYKCDGNQWEPAESDLKAVRFRVLIPGNSEDEDAIYSAYNTNSIDDLNDTFFGDIAVPSSKAPTYHSNQSDESSSNFNADHAYLIWIRIDEGDGSFRNALMRVKEVVINPDDDKKSTLRFDILMQKADDDGGNQNPETEYDEYKGITIGAQNSEDNNSFFLEDGSVTGACGINGQETNLDFLLYMTGGGELKLYGPHNTGSITKSYKCEGVEWAPNTGDLKTTKFRVLIPGNSGDEDAIYTAYNTNGIDNLEDAFFGSISDPSSSAPKYDPAQTNESSSVFNTDHAYLIWVRMDEGDGSFRNALMRVNEINMDATDNKKSTLKFDILMQKN